MERINSALALGAISIVRLKIKGQDQLLLLLRCLSTLLRSLPLLLHFTLVSATKHCSLSYETEDPEPMALVRV